MESTLLGARHCASGRHLIDELSYSYVWRKWRCKECANEFGQLYDYEWSEADIANLLADFKVSKQCRCGGPYCGINATRSYALSYPMFASLFEQSL